MKKTALLVLMLLFTSTSFTQTNGLLIKSDSGLPEKIFKKLFANDGSFWYYLHDKKGLEAKSTK